jgi:hypothetical protein
MQRVNVYAQAGAVARAELIARLRFAESVLSGQTPPPPALALIVKTLKREVSPVPVLRDAVVFRPRTYLGSGCPALEPPGSE